MGATLCRTSRSMKAVKLVPPGDGLLWGLALLSCLLGGWLLGYGVSPSIRDWRTSGIPSKLNGVSSVNDPASYLELPSWKSEPRTKKSDSVNWSGDSGATDGSN